MVSDIPAGDGNVGNLFFTVYNIFSWGGEMYIEFCKQIKPALKKIQQYKMFLNDALGKRDRLTSLYINGGIIYIKKTFVIVSIFQ